jgi:hypothetical protein
MTRLKERPATELPAGLQQMLVLAHKNKTKQVHGSKGDLAHAWFGATSTAINTEMYEDWQNTVVAPKLAEVRQDPAREAAVAGGIFRDRHAQVKTKNFRPVAEQRTGQGRRNGRLNTDSGSDASSRDRDSDEDERAGHDNYHGAVVPFGFLPDAAARRGPAPAGPEPAPRVAAARQQTYTEESNVRSDEPTSELDYQSGLSGEDTETVSEEESSDSEEERRRRAAKKDKKKKKSRR